MSGGNGVDAAAVYELLRQVADRVIAHDQQLAEMRVELRAVRADMSVARAELREIRMEMAGMRTEIRDLRLDVRTYTGSVFAQGVRIEAINERPRRVERHLNLAPGK